nr:hypothetical protein [Lichenibacterium minor]
MEETGLPYRVVPVRDRSAVQRSVDLAKELRRSAPPTEEERRILFNQSARS